MVSSQLRELLRNQPFRPFRLILSSGQTYDVPSPEWMLVTAATTAIGMPGVSGDGEIVSLLANEHIANVEYLKPEATR